MNYTKFCQDCKDLLRCYINKDCDRYKCKIVSCRFKEIGLDKYIEQLEKSNKNIMNPAYGFFSESMNFWR